MRLQSHLEMAQKAQNTTLISREQAKEFFSAMDLNKDGKVQHTELARAMKQIYGVDENTTMVCPIKNIYIDMEGKAVV